MGWGDCGDDSTGRPIGYVFEATCDHPNCDKEIDRGLAYACGQMHGEDLYDCENYYCYDHLNVTVIDGDDIYRVCEECSKTWDDGSMAWNGEEGVWSPVG